MRNIHRRFVQGPLITEVLDLSYVVPVKSTVEISQNFVAFSEYMNFTSTSTSNQIMKKHLNVLFVMKVLKK